jgi:hypothetical protein
MIWYNNLNKVMAFLLFMACTGCGKKETVYEPPIFERHQQIDMEVINDTFMFSAASYMAVYDSILIVCDPYINPVIYLFNRHNGAFLKSAGIVGAGPGELITPVTFSLDHKREILHVYDAGKIAVIKFNIRDILNDTLSVGEETKLYKTLSIHSARYLKDSLFLAYGYPEGLFITAGNDESVNRKGLIPANPPDMAPKDWTRFLCSWSAAAVRPDGSKYVTATTLGGIIDVYSIDETGIKPSVSRFFYKPVYDMKQSLFAINTETVFGFCYLSATNDFLYATAHGKANPTEMPKTIWQFDWKANPVASYECNYSIENFTIDETARRVYAAVYDEEGELVLASGSLQSVPPVPASSK